jgi:hypothetical protein
MSVTTTVDHSQRRVFVRAVGPVTFNDILVHIAEERRAVGLQYEELIDARGYLPEFSSDEVRRLAAALRDLALDAPLRPTAVVSDSDVGYGMLRMIEAMVEEVCAIRPFRTMSEAEDWLAEISHSAI